MSRYPLSIPKQIEAVITKVRAAKLEELQGYDPTIQTISYIYGNILEVIKKLQAWTNNNTMRYQKYPLFILIEDIQIDRTDTRYYGIPTLEVIICNHTKKDYTSDQREEINFSNILRPLYEEFLLQLSKHKGFAIQNDMAISHRVTERKYWGEDDNTANKLGDYIDAIHITQLSFPLTRNICEIELIIETS